MQLDEKALAATLDALKPFAEAAREFTFAIAPDGIDDGIGVVAATVVGGREAILCTADFSRARNAFNLLAALPPESPAQQPATDAVDARRAMMTARYLDGVRAGFGAAQADNPNAALRALIQTRAALSQPPAKAGESLQQRPAAEEKRT